MPEVSLYSLLPDPEALLALEPEELAGVVLQYLNSCDSNSGQLNRYNFSLPHTVQQYPEQYRGRISKALMEAWAWCSSERHLTQTTGHSWTWPRRFPSGKHLRTFLPERLAHTRTPIAIETSAFNLKRQWR